MFKVEYSPNIKLVGEENQVGKKGRERVKGGKASFSSLGKGEREA